ncbi:MAG: hypothetical protein ACRDFB_09800 [Rhabdochlamydiaceae bacterium]
MSIVGSKELSLQPKRVRLRWKRYIIDCAKIQERTGVKTRAGAQMIINRFIKLEILTQRDPKKTYGRTYEYRAYLDLYK